MAESRKMKTEKGLALVPGANQMAVILQLRYRKTAEHL